MYAIIEDSGTQIKVAPGDVVEIDLRDPGSKNPKDKISFDRVLMVGDQGDGGYLIPPPSPARMPAKMARRRPSVAYTAATAAQTAATA